MEYPFILRGERRGSVSLGSEGLFTVLEVWAEGREEGILRISLYGQGRESYLGVMEPRGSGMYLRRRLSRREMEKLPSKIEYAAEAGLSQAGKPEGAPPLSPTAPQALSGAADEAPEPGELIWYKKPDGTLWAFDGERGILAIPAKLRHGAKGAVLRVIEGQEYMLFHY